MPRTALTKTVGTSPNPSALVTLTMGASDASNSNSVTFTGREVVIFQNSGLSTRTITITSVADPYGRLGTITTENIVAGAFKAIGPLGIEGWRQNDGMLYITTTHAEVLIGVYTLA